MQFIDHEEDTLVLVPKLQLLLEVVLNTKQIFLRPLLKQEIK